jgi:hypothetical protein
MTTAWRHDAAASVLHDANVHKFTKGMPLPAQYYLWGFRLTRLTKSVHGEMPVKP